MTQPYFLWDYDLTEDEVKKMLQNGSDAEKRWLIGRILEHAHFRDVFRYLSLQNIIAYFPKLKLRPIMRKYWQRAFHAWGFHVPISE